MKLPGKTTTYKNSVIALFPVILKLLRKNDMPVTDLYEQVNADYGNFTGALDCLYALGKIELNDGRLLHYVDTDSL